MVKLNLKGQRFGRLVALSYTDSSKWSCVCDCGKKILVLASNLKNESTKSCGCLKKENGIDKIKDISKQRFGKLLAISYAGSGKWNCICDCGNKCSVAGYSLKKGLTKSCGCLYRKSLIGQRFGKLIVISRAEVQSKWNCLCDCGNKKTIFVSSLKNGTRSCGCLRNELNDLTGKRFGKLIVTSRAENKKGKAQWNSVCDCGNKKIIPTYRLKKSKSCGCLRKPPDMVGKRFGKIKVLSYAGKGRWNYLCDCGKTSVSSTQSLLKINKTVKSCGCVPNYNKYADETLAAKHYLYISYKKGAKRRNRPFLLGFEEFINLVQQKCHYCGEEPLQCSKNKYAKNFYYNGLDRVDNDKGYVIDNVKPCCFKCNNAKQKRRKEEFITWVEKCYNNLWKTK